MITTALVIGDEHFKTKNIPEVELFITKIIKVAIDKKPTFIVSLGDLLDTHERLHTIPYNKALEFIDKLRQIAPVYSLVGNHDMTSHHNFLSENHWMTTFRNWENVTVVDKVISQYIDDKMFVFIPYVYPGRFEEALNTIGKEWTRSKCIFAHQEFYGCKMGAIISEIGDKWPENYPNVISGHIHLKQKPQKNIYYTGSAMQHAYGESSENTIAYVTFNDENEYKLEEINLGLPRKKIIYTDLDNIKNFKLTNTNDQIKISLNGTYEEFKTFKNSSKYKNLISNGVKIVFSHDKKNEIDEEYTNLKFSSFKDTLKSLIEGEENSDDLNNIYMKIL